ncbi:GNAT family N-acetyltransferase [Tenacibaculum sp.]|uniref:GNAT family N-acetyltransferase n=1 Tax=Tenacibaculum sp. TaxID=1906242 RepID=UPI003AA80A10
MNIFETNRLLIRTLKKEDSEDYFDMMGNPNVMNPIPRKVMTKEESNNHLNNFLNQPEISVWAIELKSENNFIGLCAFLKNNENEDEIGYRLREKYWKKGYGTEVTVGLLNYGFDQMKMDKITADVDTRNLNSVKILEKFMTAKKEFFNEADNCTDRRYEISKKTGYNTVYSK